MLASSLGVACAGLGAAALPAEAASTSTNWAGYAASGTKFRRAAGTWVVPTAKCPRGSKSYSAAWVGLGGLSKRSTSLEQTGTEIDCSSSGRATYLAWYELVPANARRIRMKVRPGDTISASVAVSGKRVAVSFVNRTTGVSFRKSARMSSPDITSADWIVEAPSECDSSGNCTQLPLGDFGSMSFTGASATSTRGHTGTVSDGAWRKLAIELNQSPRLVGAAAASGAVPSGLSADGASFSVTYHRQGSSFAQPGTTSFGRSTPAGG